MAESLVHFADYADEKGKVFAVAVGQYLDRFRLGVQFHSRRLRFDVDSSDIRSNQEGRDCDDDLAISLKFAHLLQWMPNVIQYANGSMLVHICHIPADCASSLYDHWIHGGILRASCWFMSLAKVCLCGDMMWVERMLVRRLLCS